MDSDCAVAALALAWYEIMRAFIVQYLQLLLHGIHLRAWGGICPFLFHVTTQYMDMLLLYMRALQHLVVCSKPDCAVDVSSGACPVACHTDMP